ncbi:MAG: hypothetical protein RMI94_15410, partial [Bryobacterales bacterium]|nr:hypothetical protein [Bryobacterales bacterium]
MARLFGWLTRRLEFVAAAAWCALLLVRYLAPTSLWAVLLALAVSGLTAALLLRWLRWGIRKLLWRLRNRLLVAYLFIAVVPMALLSGLVASAAWILTGQIAVYVAASELERRAKMLSEVAQGLARTPPASLPDRLRWIGPYLRERHPGLELAVFRREGSWRYPPESSLEKPPPAWEDRSGLLVKDGLLYLWAHVVRAAAEVVILVPMDAEARASLARQLAAVSVFAPPAPASGRAGHVRVKRGGNQDQLDESASRLPPPANWLDREVDYAAPVPVSYWQMPNQSQTGILFVRTRCSAVLR